MPNYLIESAKPRLFTFGTATAGPVIAGTTAAGSQLVEGITLGAGLSITGGALTLGSAGGPYVLKAGDQMSGPLSLNGTPFAPAWAYTSAGSIELGRRGTGISGVSGGTLSLTQNAYIDASGANWVYANNGYAMLIQSEVGTGQLTLYTAPSGTAGNNITGLSGKFYVFGAGSGTGLDGTVHCAEALHAGSYSSTKYSLFGYKNSSSIPAAYFRQDNSSGNMAEFSAGGSASQITIPYAGGILFPATQVANSNANALDDYEEGTFTPTSGTTNVTLSNATSGYYTKVGRKVTFSLYSNITNNTGAPITSLQINSLPFAVNAGYYGWAHIHYPNYGWCSNSYIQSGNSYALLALGSGSWPTGASSIMLSGTYFV